MDEDLADHLLRSELRAPIELKVEYTRLNAFFADYTKNISRGGTFIQTERPLPVGTDFAFSLVVPGFGEPLFLRGRVRWVVATGDSTGAQPPGMGIAFVFETEQDRRRIVGLVEGLMADHLGAHLSETLLGRTPREPTT